MEKLVLVHLSDIHFTRLSGTSRHDLDAELRNELVRDAAKVTGSLGGATGIVVTGDIAYSGKRTEYDCAASWLLEACRSIGCREESVWVVPGNHDVDRALANGKVTQALHKSIRGKEGAELARELRETLSDQTSAEALLKPLSEYNSFAARFECSFTAESPYWERDLALDCGTIVRLRGLCSVLVSNQHDERPNIVLGEYQVNVHRVDGVVHLTLCHHPPDWLKDQDDVITHLESKVGLQLFGHKHAQRVQVINGNLRVTAGAMHPDRGGQNWEPIYNIIEIARSDDRNLTVRLFQRRWHNNQRHFLADQDANTNHDYREFLLACPRPRPKVNDSKALVAPEAEAKTDVKDSNPMPAPDPERRLTFRFLTLPFRHQIAVAGCLNVLVDNDRSSSEEVLFHKLFERASAQGLLASLWAETESRHSDPAAFNPFES